MSKTGFVPSIKESELKEDQMKPVHVKGKSILLARQAKLELVNLAGQYFNS
jgi:hypothetical protein